MSQRAALSLALGLTAFVLVLLGGVTMYLNPAATNAAAQPALQPAVDALAPQVSAEREASYQAALQEANEQLRLAHQRLEQAYADQRALADQVDQASASGGQAASYQSAYLDDGSDGERYDHDDDDHDDDDHDNDDHDDDDHDDHDDDDHDDDDD